MSTIDDVEEFSSSSESGTENNNSSNEDTSSNDSSNTNRGGGSKSGQGNKNPSGNGQNPPNGSTGGGEGSEGDNGDKDGNGNKEGEGENENGNEGGTGSGENKGSNDGSGDGNEGKDGKGKGENDNGAKGKESKSGKEDGSGAEGGKEGGSEGNGNSSGDGKDEKGDEQGNGDKDGKPDDKGESGSGGNGDSEDKKDGDGDGGENKEEDESGNQQSDIIYRCQSLLLFDGIIKKTFDAIDLIPEFYLLSERVKFALKELNLKAIYNEGNYEIKLEKDSIIPKLDEATTKAMLLQIKNNANYFKKENSTDYSNIEKYLYDAVKAYIIDTETNEQFESFVLKYYYEGETPNFAFVSEINLKSKLYQRRLMLFIPKINNAEVGRKVLININNRYNKAFISHLASSRGNQTEEYRNLDFMEFIDDLKKSIIEFDNSKKSIYITAFKQFINFVNQ